MNKKLAAALSGSVVLLMTLSACGDNKEAKLGAWAEKVCVQIEPQVKNIRTSNTSIGQVAALNSSRRADIQQSSSAAFQSISDAYKALASEVNSVGAPPASNGATIQKDVVREFSATSAAYADLKKQADALDVKNVTEFADGMKGVASGTNKAISMGGQAFQKLQSGQLGAAMEKQKVCHTTSTAAGPGAASPSS